MPERSADWFRQAERDLQLAETSLEAGFYEWACFASHQAAEKAVKAVYAREHGEAWGHVVSRLLARLSDPPGEDLVDAAKSLDKHYIPTRYPNGFEAGAPADFYTRSEADRAVDHARAIIDYCGRRLPG